MSGTVSNNTHQIKCFITAVYDYFLGQPEKVLTQLQRQIQVFSNTDDLSFFEPTCMVTLEFYHCLDQLLSRPEAKNTLAWKTVMLISHMTRSKPVLLALRDEIQILFVLTNYLQTDNLSRDKYGKTLLLVQKISYGIKIEHLTAWLQRLLPHLCQTIVHHLGRDGTVDRVSEEWADNSLVFPALGTLSNLCRDNPCVVRCLKTSTNFSSVLKSLMTISGSSNKQQLVCVELYLTLQARVSVAINIKASDVVSRAMQVCEEEVSHSEHEAIHIATDALNCIASMSHMMDGLQSYELSSTFCESLLNQVDHCNQDTMSEVASFLAVLVRLLPRQMATLHSHLVEKAVSCSQRDYCSSSVLQLLHALVNTASDSALEEHLQHFVSAVKHLLAAAAGTQLNLHRLAQLVDGLHLLHSLTHRNDKLTMSVSMSIPHHLFTDLVQPLMEFTTHINHMRQRGSIVSRKYSDANTGYDMDATIACLNVSNAVASRANSSCLATDVTLDHRLPSTFVADDGATSLCSEAILRLVVVIKKLATHNGQYKIQHSQLLARSCLMPHLAGCMHSRRLTIVTLATQLLTDALPKDSVGAFVSSMHELNQRDSRQQSVSTAATPEYDDFDGMDTSTDDTSPDAGSINQRMDEIMAWLKAIADKPDMKDQPLTGLVDLYEFKLAGMAHAEQTTQGMLVAYETKNRTLQRSVMLAEVENCRCRQLMRQREERLSAARERQQRGEQVHEQLFKDMAAFREAALMEKVKLEREAAQLRERVLTKHSETEAWKVKCTRAAQQLALATEDNTKLHTENKRIKEAKQGADEAVVALKSSNADTRLELDNLFKKYAELEKMMGNQKKENRTLENINKKLESANNEKDQQIEQLTESVGKLKMIQDMIHDMSSAKGVRDSRDTTTS